MDYSLFINHFPSVCEWYWNRKWKESNVTFRMRSDSSKVSLVNTKLKEKLGYNFSLNIPLFTGGSVEKAYKCWDYVRHHITYKSDKSLYGLNEHWETPEEVFNKREADCEGGAHLLMKLMEHNNIPAWRRKLCAGWVLVNGKLEGHGYVIFLADDFEWYVLDWSYWPSMSKRCWLKTPHRKLDNFYDSIWFTFNEEKIWGEHDYVIGVEDGIYEK